MDHQNTSGVIPSHLFDQTICQKYYIYRTNTKDPKLGMTKSNNKSGAQYKADLRGIKI